MSDNKKLISCLIGFLFGYVFFKRGQTTVTSLSTGVSFTEYNDSLYDKFKVKIKDLFGTKEKLQDLNVEDAK